MDQLRLQGMEAVDTVLALLRGVHDLEILREVVETLELEIEEENRGNRRFILRTITNHIESDEFDGLGNVAVERINTLKVESFAGRNFRDFANFSVVRKS